jgi:uncharacterized membrane protein (UPF0127 family)
MRQSSNMARFAFLLGAIFCLTAPAFAQQAAIEAGEPMRLEAEKLTIVTGQGSFEFDVELADEPFEQQRGLMFRTDLPTRRGMLFAFGKPRLVTMWMKNTPLSLDMVFLNADGTVAHIAERTTPFSEEIVSSGGEVAFALELNAGVSRLIGLKVGDRLELPKRLLNN